MHRFEAGGHTWEIELRIPIMEHVRDRTNVDIGRYESLAAMQYSSIDLVDVLWVVVESQAKENKVDRDAFRNMIYGDALGEARKAYLEEYYDFCPSELTKVLRPSVAKAEENHRKLVQLSQSQERQDSMETLSNDAIAVQES